jgi:hypothetical protein
MGAIAVDCVHSLASAKETKGYDFVLVEDREKKTELPEWLRNLDRACNIPWLKQCLVGPTASSELTIDHGRIVEARTGKG